MAIDSKAMPASDLAHFEEIRDHGGWKDADTIVGLPALYLVGDQGCDVMTGLHLCRSSRK